MRKLRVLLIIVLFTFLVFSSTSGRFLVVNDLAPADVIVVLAGETNQRPSRALQLLSQNYAPRVQLDVPANDVAYDRSMIDIAKEYVQKLPQAQSITICPIIGLSTKAESHDVARCLDHFRSSPHSGGHIGLPHAARKEHFPARTSRLPSLYSPGP